MATTTVSKESLNDSRLTSDPDEDLSSWNDEDLTEAGAAIGFQASSSVSSSESQSRQDLQETMVGAVDQRDSIGSPMEGSRTGDVEDGIDVNDNPTTRLDGNPHSAMAPSPPGDDIFHANRSRLGQEEVAPPTPTPPMEEEIPPEQSRPTLTDPRDQERRAKRFLLWVFIVAAALVVFMGTIFAAASSEQQYYNSSNNRNNQMVKIYPPFQYDLPYSTLGALNDSASVQYRGNAWMWRDPHLYSYHRERQLQRFALATLYFGTGGPNWTRSDHWLDYDVPECAWFTTSQDPICDQYSNLVTVDLRSNNLRGTIPKEALYIPYLFHSDLSNNSIGGTIPNFALNTYLQVYRISDNRLSGPFLRDYNVVSASRLKEIHMDGNHLSGDIAPMFRKFPRLEELNLTSNQFTGRLPSEVQYATNLKYLGLGHNYYRGPVPTELGVLDSLQAVDLSANRALTGTIPSELEGMSYLEILDISMTTISGEVPPGLCGLIAWNEAIFVADCDSGLLQCCV